MTTLPIRAEEFETDETLARTLVATQFPQWADWPLARVNADSTDNDMYRLGREMAVRLPRRASAVAPMEKEHIWLPRLAAQLPLPLPLPLAKGSPGEGYPWSWSVVAWIEGHNPSELVCDALFARDLAGYVSALHAIDTSGGPTPGAHNFWRGAPLNVWNANMRQRFAWLADLGDIGLITAIWDAALLLPPWETKPVWIHGDIQRGNILERDGRLAALIDWSALGVGDPANDLSVAWTLLDQSARDAFREAVRVDDATWRRGRAWALVEGVQALSYYRKKNEAIATSGRRVINAVLGDSQRSS